MSSRKGRMILCYRPSRSMILASKVGVEVYEVVGGRYRLVEFYPACSVLRVDLEHGLIYLRDGGSRQLPCRVVEQLAVPGDELPTV